MLTLKIAFRNVFRQKRRSILTLLTMAGGFILAAISIGWADGTYSNIINMFTRNRIGHIQIHQESYLDRPALYKTISDYEMIGARLQQLPGVEAWTPRIYSAGLASVEDKSAGVQILGIDPEREVHATRFDKKVIAGRSLSFQPAYEAILGRGLAKVLQAQVNSEIVLVSQGTDGSIANDLYTVVGIVDSGDTLADRAACYLHLQDAQELLVLENRVHEFILIAGALRQVNTLTTAVKRELGDTNLEVSPWQEVAKPFYNAMQADQQGMWITLFIIVLIVSVEVLNTVLMSVLERTREYGVLKAVGTRPAQILRLVLYEVAILALVSVCVGAGLSLLINSLLSQHGISYPEPMTYGGMEFQTMYSEVNARSVYIPAMAVFLSAVFVSIFPGLKAARTAPAKSMRTH